MGRDRGPERRTTQHMGGIIIISQQPSVVPSHSHHGPLPSQRTTRRRHASAARRPHASPDARQAAKHPPRRSVAASAKPGFFTGAGCPGFEACGFFWVLGEAIGRRQQARKGSSGAVAGPHTAAQKKVAINPCRNTAGQPIYMAIWQSRGRSSAQCYTGAIARRRSASFHVAEREQR